MQLDSFTVVLGVGAVLVLLLSYAIFGIFTEGVRSVHQSFAEDAKKKKDAAKNQH